MGRKTIQVAEWDNLSGVLRGDQIQWYLLPVKLLTLFACSEKAADTFCLSEIPESGLQSERGQVHSNL